MKHFLALRLSDQPRDRLAAVADRLREWQLPATWVHPEDYHLTLVFLGRLDADEARTLPYSLGGVAEGLFRPSLRLSGLGATGGRTEPRAVYAGVADPEGLCRQAHLDLSAVLGLDPERAFMPHITLCRPRPPAAHDHGNPRRAWPQLLEAHGLADWGDCPMTDLVLYRTSERTPKYQVVASWPLLKAA